ncbi:ABC-F family ATP-binding cassette domain-containing protein [Candidatus Kaiserbacteria bacterium]|nr:ABC-F family ATP-binding cassette domain-containing protein [Candidatus Kaiserbacteria bacterium]
MAKEETIVRFEGASFEYGPQKPILDEVDFNIRRGSKITIMGQNGAGKSTIFGLITGAHTLEDGEMHIPRGLTIATSRQVIPRAEMDLTVREFFEKCFRGKMYDIDPRIDEALEVVNLKGHEKVHDRIIKSFSGGQQARLLLASALIQNPDLLLLDEPTNNLDHAGIKHLTEYLIEYPKTVVVISHDADFLNAFSDGVLYLDVKTRKVEQYTGNYFNVVKQITERIERENRKNALLAKEIQANKDKINYFAHKGGKMRLIAKKMRDQIQEMEDEVVDVRKEDKTIKAFVIPVQDIKGEILHINLYNTIKNHKSVSHKANVSLKRGKHLLLKGPNGIGKSTLLESIATGTATGATIGDGVKVGYYRQDFSTLNFEDTVYKSLEDAMPKPDEEKMRAIAAGFLITADIINTRIGHLSEGQKGLVAFARLVLERPGLLILDEPTNHINFRHLPVIAKALSEYEGAMVLVSHVPEFVAQIRIDEVLDLEK